MRKKERRRQEKRVRHLVEQWAEPMGLLWWKIDVVYYADYDECRGLFAKPGDASVETVATTYASWQYLEATIEVNLQRVAKMDDDDLAYTVIHELAHVLVNEMREVEQEGGVAHEERVVTTVAKALRWTREYGQKEGALSRRAAERGFVGKRRKR